MGCESQNGFDILEPLCEEPKRLAPDKVPGDTENGSEMTVGERHDTSFGPRNWSREPEESRRTLFRNPFAGTRFREIIKGKRAG